MTGMERLTHSTPEQAAEAPSMSVILMTMDSIEPLRWVLSQYAMQTIARRIEVVIVCPQASAVKIDSKLAGSFFAIRVTERHPLQDTSDAFATGVRIASAPIIALGEDHSFPASKDWAEVLLKRHAEPWVGVGPVIGCANPASAVSYSDYLMSYGQWMAPNHAGEVAFVPGHNSTYKRSQLLELGDRLLTLFENEIGLQEELRAHGGKFYQEAAATTLHTNFELLATFLKVQFYVGRIFTGSRARHWPTSRRIIYFAGSPLIPVLRLVRIIRQVRRAGAPMLQFARALPAMIAGLCMFALGEATAYIFPPGNKGKQWLFQFETKRYLYAPSIRSCMTQSQA
jgi:hypothetical protein